MTEAQQFDGAYREVYLAFHRRDAKRSELPNASRAVLTHLAQAGPLTIGETARHLDRAQSVVSEIVDGLSRHGLVEREPDPADRRRTLVWLTARGRERLVREAEVLDVARLADALGRLPAAHVRGLLDGLRALVAAAPTPPTEEPER